MSTTAPIVLDTPAQIVQCHNLHGGYFDLRALQWLSARVPTLLTLHDMWTLTGHCAHALGCDRWRTGCGRCPDLKLDPAIRADAYPSKPVRVVNAYSAGGTADVICRVYCQALSTRLGQTFTVDNKPGAAGTLAAGIVAHAPADGYTLLYDATAQSVNPSLFGAKLPYDTRKDFVPVSRITNSANILVVPVTMPVKNTADLVALATVADVVPLRGLNRALVADLQTCLDAEAVNMMATMSSADHREAAAAFLEGRAPVYEGR